MAVIVVASFTVLLIRGIPYYQTGKEERAFHADHELLKPSGTIAHGAGIFGTFFMITVMASYMARKRFRFMSGMGFVEALARVSYLPLYLGPVLILFSYGIQIRRNCSCKLLVHGRCVPERDNREIHLSADPAFD